MIFKEIEIEMREKGRFLYERIAADKAEGGRIITITLLQSQYNVWSRQESSINAKAIG